MSDFAQTFDDFSALLQHAILLASTQSAPSRCSAISQSQIAILKDQSEGQVSPALRLEMGSEGTGSVVSVRNIGAHAAFDVQLQPVPPFQGNGDILFERIAVIEKNKTASVKIAQEQPGGWPEAVLTTRAFQEIMKEDAATVMCKSISNRPHLL